MEPRYCELCHFGVVITKSALPIIPIPVGDFFAIIISGDSHVLRLSFFPVHIHLEWRKWQLDESGQLDDLGERDWLPRRSRRHGFIHKQFRDL
jgi:hypothetical protein